MKGEAAAADYPDPNLRLLGDIDVLVDPENLEKVGKLLESKGFEADAEENGSHRVYRSHSIRIEVHWKIPGMPENEALAAYLRDVIKDAVTVGGEFKAPCDEHQILILLLHAKHHILYEGIGLRHLCDIAVLFNKTANDDFYEKSLVPLLENAGLATFAKIVAKTCSIYLGSSLPDFAKDADDDTCREFIEDIFAGGNFGEKDDGRIRSGSVIKDGKGKSAAGSMFATLGENVRARAKGRKILYPFLYIGLSVKYLFLVIFGKRPTPKETASDINKRAELYKKMQIM
ncbi:MAG: nucleotidyltransferase family protein [Clostridia bacterium]|nr:nucleotidyltransferase family protein [Clostridia bacterium]